MLLILLTTLLGFIAILSSWSAIQDRVRPYYVFLLLLQTGMLGVFCSLDMFLFYVFWEVMLVPMYFLIGIWGGERRLYAAIKFFLYTLVGSVVMLLGILALYFQLARAMPGFEATGTFDVTVWYQMANGLPLEFQKWVFLAFFLGFAVKVPMFPFHTWLPDAHVQAPTAGSVILAGVLLKMGTYGFLRFSLPLLPQATLWAVPWMAALAIIGIVYAALVTLVQKDMKKLIAYSSVSHLGFVMLGMFALNPLGLEGSVLQMINHGLSTGGLFLLVGVLYERRHTKEISAFGGIAHVMPVYATITLIIFLASMGLPLLNGFIGEAMILLGAYAANKAWAYWAVSGIVLGAAYLLWLYQRVFWGPITHEENRNLPDLNARELATLVPLVVLCFWIGVYPKPFLAFLHRPMGQTRAPRSSPPSSWAGRRGPRGAARLLPGAERDGGGAAVARRRGGAGGAPRAQRNGRRAAVAVRQPRARRAAAVRGALQYAVSSGVAAVARRRADPPGRGRRRHPRAAAAGPRVAGRRAHRGGQHPRGGGAPSTSRPPTSCISDITMPGEDGHALHAQGAQPSPDPRRPHPRHRPHRAGHPRGPRGLPRRGLPLPPDQAGRRPEAGGDRGRPGAPHRGMTAMARSDAVWRGGWRAHGAPVPVAGPDPRPGLARLPLLHPDLRGGGLGGPAARARAERRSPGGSGGAATSPPPCWSCWSR